MMTLELAYGRVAAAKAGRSPRVSTRTCTIHPGAAPHSIKRRLGQNIARGERYVPMRFDVGDLLFRVPDPRGVKRLHVGLLGMLGHHHALCLQREIKLHLASTTHPGLRATH